MSINNPAASPESLGVGSESSGSTASGIDWLLAPYRELITHGLHAAISEMHAALPSDQAVDGILDEFYGQIEYHLGWRQPDLTPATYDPGKLLRGTLVLLACELAASQSGLNRQERMDLLGRITPAAVSIELVHNFSLIHDDIEDGDEERRHRPTLWKLWGVPQAVNTGDGLFSLARMELWQLAGAGIEAPLILRLAELLDRTCVELCEGQFLDMRYEGRNDISVVMYLDMIGRKTAALMSCATGFGGCLGAPDNASLQARLARFGRALGIAFQLRDDLLGIWEAQQLGKTVAGDLRRKKMSLPIIHALETADASDYATLQHIMTSRGAASEEDIGEALAILDRTGARMRISRALEEQGAIARAALEEGVNAKGRTNEAYSALSSLLDFVLATE